MSRRIEVSAALWSVSNGAPQLTLSPDSVVVGVFESSPLIATVRDASGAIQYVALEYVSRDQSVATVNANGAIRAVAVGSTYVVATLCHTCQAPNNSDGRAVGFNAR